MNAVWRSIVRNLTPLLVFTLCAALVVGWVYQATHQRIEQQRYEQRLQTLREVLGALEFDNRVLETRVRIEGYGHPESTKAPVQAFVVALEGEPRALVLPVLVADGYSGPIALLLAVEFSPARRILGLRVSRHRETPGLGDGIDLRKSDWILGFAGRSLDNPEEPLWAVRRDGGVFDQFTGATITPRAVVRGVRNALIQFDQEREALYRAALQALADGGADDAETAQ